MLNNISTQSVPHRSAPRGSPVCNDDQMNDADTTLLGAFERARKLVQEHMRRSYEFDYSWNEETITDILLVGAAPFVKAVPFTKRQEGGEFGTGADWLWWWLGDAGECFGMLVQAKRLKKTDGGRWTIDFEYNAGKQLTSLLDTADALQVAPAYLLYFGPPNYRQPVECGTRDHPSDFDECKACGRKSVTFLPAILATLGGGAASDPAEAYRRSSPLEDLADPAIKVKTPLVIPSLELDPELQAFLQDPQNGPRKVAKSLIEQVCRVRAGQFELAVAEQADLITDDPVFGSMPTDQGHLYTPYFPHILRGLRRTPPGYVLEFLAGNTPIPAELADAGLAGMVVVDARSRG